MNKWQKACRGTQTKGQQQFLQVNVSPRSCKMCCKQAQRQIQQCSGHYAGHICPVNDRMDQVEKTISKVHEQQAKPDPGDAGPKPADKTKDRRQDNSIDYFQLRLRRYQGRGL